MTTKLANFFAILLLFSAASCSFKSNLMDKMRRKDASASLKKQAEQDGKVRAQQQFYAALASQELPIISPPSLSATLPLPFSVIKVSPRPIYLLPSAAPIAPAAMLTNKRTRRSVAPVVARGWLSAAAGPSEVLNLSCDSLRDQLATFAQQFIGIRYRHGGKSPAGFDCSGFTSFVLSKFNYPIPSSSSAQARVGTCVDIDKVQKGDLLIFGYRGKGGQCRTSHAALVISEIGEPLRMIHSARRGIVIDEVGGTNWRSYYAKRFLFARRVIHDGFSVEQLLGSPMATTSPLP